MKRTETLHFLPFSPSLSQEDPPWFGFVAHSLSWESWITAYLAVAYIVPAVPWITGTVPYLGIQFTISYLVSKSLCLISRSLPSMLLPTRSTPPYRDSSLLGNSSFSPALLSGARSTLSHSSNCRDNQHLP